MSEHTFACMKETKEYYRFQEIFEETGEVMPRNDPRAKINFSCLYLAKILFTGQPNNIKLTIEVTHEED